MLIQGFTCVALPNAIAAAGYTPVYCDIDPETLNIDPKQLIGKISPRTKAIICQHTFGIPSETQVLRQIADKHDLLLIEDCAHILPDVTGPKQIGKLADVCMLSFGRDKAISGISGGALVVKNAELEESILNQYTSAKKTPNSVTARLLLYPLIYALARPFYGLGIGKLFCVACRKLALLLPVLTKQEKRGLQSPLLTTMPGACCALAHKQLTSLHSMNNHRRKLTELYASAAKHHNWSVPSAVSLHLPLQKFPITVTDADAVRRKLKRKNIYLDDGWTGAAVCPRSVDAQAVGYIEGSCPKAERVARNTLCLPTHSTTTEAQAKRLVAVLAQLSDTHS